MDIHNPSRNLAYLLLKYGYTPLTSFHSVCKVVRFLGIVLVYFLNQVKIDICLYILYEGCFPFYYWYHGSLDES